MCSCGCGGSHKHDELVPMVGVITDIKDQTPDVKTFRVVSPQGGKLFEHMPGQCAMLAVPGVGEAMFSITSSPTNQEYQEFSIKRCGSLTDYLHTMEVGDEITTIGGIIGTICAVKENTIVIETGADRVRIEFTKWAVSTKGAQTSETTK